MGGVRLGARKEFCSKGHNMSETRETTNYGKTRCKICRADKVNQNKDKTVEYQKRYRSKNKTKLADDKRFKTYGITGERFREMLSEQENRCRICGRLANGKLLHVDHDHVTKKVRGLLCGNCNSALGLMGDNIESIQNMIDYLIFSNK